jgi:hypothetical protein
MSSVISLGLRLLTFQSVSSSWIIKYFSIFFLFFLQDSLEPGTFRRTESSTSMSDNDEIARRLKQFIEKLENEKTELYHQLQEEKRYVG